jgi:EmrB/QacA subfamily drug resistance transporter
MSNVTTGDRGASQPVVAPAPALPAARTTLTLVAMCLGAAMTFLEITASISGLSTIQAALHVSSANAVWIPSAYTLLVAGLILAAGTLGNRYGRKRMFSIGIVVLAVGSLVVASASGIGLVIAGQAISGVGGALILPNSVALLGVAYPDPHRRTEAITIWAASSGIGLAAGPLIAGTLLSHFSWNAVFLANPVLAVITLALTVMVVAESRQPNAGRLDRPGVALGTLTIAALVYGLIEGGHQGYASARILGVFAVAVVAAVLFVVVELGSAAPMLDVRLFRALSFSSVIVVAAVSLFGFTGISLLEVLFFQRVQQLSALDVGWRLLALFLPYILVAGLSGRLIRRIGFRVPLAGGLIGAGVVSFGLLSQDPSTGFGRIWWLFALFGIASGFIVAPSTAAAMVSVPPAQAGMASGAVNTARQVGTVLGTSILGTVLTSQLASRLPDQLAVFHVPEGARDAVVTAVASGASGAAALPAGARDAINAAFVSGVHIGFVIAGTVYLAAALLVLIGVHNRPHEN